MSEQDREDVLMIVAGVLDEYLAEELTKHVIGEIRQSLIDNWHIVKLIRERKGAEQWITGE